MPEITWTPARIFAVGFTAWGAVDLASDPTPYTAMHALVLTLFGAVALRPNVMRLWKGAPAQLRALFGLICLQSAVVLSGGALHFAAFLDRVDDDAWRAAQLWDGYDFALLIPAGILLCFITPLALGQIRNRRGWGMLATAQLITLSLTPGGYLGISVMVGSVAGFVILCSPTLMRHFGVIGAPSAAPQAA